MAKTITLNPIFSETIVQTNDNLLSGLLNKELTINPECGGRGMCSTCHVYVTEGMESLSPLNRREQRTLEIITSCSSNSRLACQARVLGEGVVVELPPGMYVNTINDLESLVGRRAEENILHPINGEILVQTGKLITRSTVQELKETKLKVQEFLAKTSSIINN